MYQSYWGLSRPAFTPEAAKQQLANSPVHAEALARLEFLQSSGMPFGLVIGPPGSGKSTVLNVFAQSCEQNGQLVALIQAAVADELALLTPLTLGFQLDAEGGTAQLWRRIADRLQEVALENLAAVVLLDDLDRAGGRVLSLVERLLALGSRLTIIASACPETAGRLGPRLLDQAALRVDLSPWNEPEARDYLTTSLANAGRSQPAFDESATRRLFELSGGAPRKVNQLARLALVAGAGQELSQIDEATIDAVEEQLSVAR